MKVGIQEWFRSLEWAREAEPGVIAPIISLARGRGKSPKAQNRSRPFPGVCFGYKPVPDTESITILYYQFLLHSRIYIYIYIYMLTYLSRRQQLDHPFPPGRPPYPSLFRHPHTTHPYHPITSTTERMVHFNPPSLHHHLFRSRSPSLSPHYLSLI